MTAQNDATASCLGYVFQGQYALLTLWDAEGDVAVVSVEPEDDVELKGNEPRLAQLKHSTGTPATLTVTDVGLWKTGRTARWAATHPAASMSAPCGPTPRGSARSSTRATTW